MPRGATSAILVLLAVIFAGACGGGSGADVTAVDASATSPATSETTAQAQCPPDVTLPIPTRTCPTARDSGAGKLMGQFPQDGSPIVVVVGVSGAAPVCPIATCRGGCPEQTSITDFWAAENFASQTCVRDFISAVGGTATDERFWIVDALVATLTWDQIQVVATHPHVTSIEPNMGGPPP